MIEMVLCDITNPHNPRVVATVFAPAIPPEGTVIVYRPLSDAPDFIGRVTRVEMLFTGSSHAKTVVQLQEVDAV
jgi:hypothetical protein